MTDIESRLKAIETDLESCATIVDLHSVLKLVITRLDSIEKRLPKARGRPRKPKLILETGSLKREVLLHLLTEYERYRSMLLTSVKYGQKSIPCVCYRGLECLK